MNGLVWLAAVAAIFAALLRPKTAHRGVGCSPSARPSVRVTRPPYDWSEEEAVEGHDPNCAVCAESERRRLQAIYPDSLA